MSAQLPPPPRGISTWPTWLGIGMMAVLARLPWSLQRALARPLGALLRLLMRSRHHVAARNIALCFPALSAAQQQAILRTHFRDLALGMFEFGRAWWGSVAPLQHNLRVRGLEHVQKAQAQGRGVIVLSGHFTTLEVCGRLMCDYIPLAGMYRPHKQAAMEWAVRRGRARYAVAMFPKHDVRGAVRHLKKGGLLWYAPDQDPSRGEAVYVPFFGQAAHSLSSTHQLARLSGASVLFFQHARREDGGYDLEIIPLDGSFPSDDAKTDTARIMAGIESMVRTAPAQYLWIHRRFKRQPDGRDLYRTPL